MGSQVLEELSRVVGHDFMSNICAIKTRVQEFLRKIWTIEESYPVSIVPSHIQGWPLKPVDAEEAFSAMKPTVWRVQDKLSRIEEHPPEYLTYIKASNSAITVLSAVQALCLGQGCKMALDEVG